MTEPLFSPADLRNLVERFYERARGDVLLGPIFEATVTDWPAHFDTLTAFWSMVMNGPRPDMPVFKGRPLPRHMALPLRRAHFERWLDLWVETTGELFDAPRAEALREKAWRIGQSFQAAQALSEMSQNEMSLNERPLNETPLNASVR